MAMNVYTMFGTQTAKKGDAFPLTAKVADTVWNKM
jgi:hypothetical protein